MFLTAEGALHLFFTTVVTLVVVSEYCESPPEGEGWEGRLHIDGPIYALDRVVQLAIKHESVVLWTKKSIKDAQTIHSTSGEEFDSDAAYVAGLVTELPIAGRYQKSEWCHNGVNAIAACDSYVLKRRERISGSIKSQVIEYYLKFAIGKTGQVVLSISNHL